MQKNNDLNPPDHKLFTLSRTNLEEYFDHDEEDIQSFTAIVLKDWSKIRSDIQQAINNTDYQLYDDSTHKMLSVIRMLKANRLEHAIKCLEQGFNSKNPAKLKSASTSFFDAMDEVIDML